MAEANGSGRKNKKVGEVVSARMNKTIVVEVTRRVTHPVYKRIVTRRKKFYAHDENNSARLGDVVQILECRPMSRLKRWRLGEIVRRVVQVGSLEEALGKADTAERGKGQRRPAPEAGE